MGKLNIGKLNIGKPNLGKPNFRIKRPQFQRETEEDLRIGVYTAIIYIFLCAVFYSLFKFSAMDITAGIMSLSAVVFFFIMSVHLFEFYKFKYQKDKSFRVAGRFAIAILLTAAAFLMFLGQAIVFIQSFTPDYLEVLIGLAIFLPMFSWWEILHAKVKR